MYTRPVHYKKADGSWDDIDTAFSQGRDERWHEAANKPMASFARKADEPALARWTVDADHQVSYSLKGARNAVGKAKGNTLTFRDAMKGADLLYEGNAVGIKETLILHDASAPSTWTFPLALTGLTASLDSSGNAQFTDAEGNIRLTIPRGYMEDSAVDPKSGEAAHSDAVTYQLTTVDGVPALVVSLDQTWLHDPQRVFPVKVDPTTNTTVNAGKSTYVMSPFTANYSSDAELKVGTYDGGSHIANSYLYFPAVSSALYNDYVLSAGLAMNNIWSYDCGRHDVYVKQITSAWNPSTINTYPGVNLAGGVVGQGSFGAGTGCSNGSSWENIDLGDDPSAAGSQLVNSWAHGGANYGLAVTASTWDSNSWKKFSSVNSSYPPYLYVTYTDWAANIGLAGSYVSPTATTSGSQQVTLTNVAANWWNSSSMQLKARIYDSQIREVASGPLTGVPGLVKTGESVTMTGIIPPLPTGQNFSLCWDGYVGGTASLHDNYGVPWQNCFSVASQNAPPQVDTFEPADGTVVGVLSPQLYALGHDPDSSPGTGLDYDFQVYSVPEAGDPQLVVESGWQSNTSWTVPAGKLSWNTTYLWTVKVGDHGTESAFTPFKSFTTTVQQPLITSRLGETASDSSGRSFDAKVGNYTTSATDASVSAVGPDLEVARSYNSLDPRTSTLFGAGWASAYDMSVVPDGDTSGSVVLTTASGRTERFGRNDFQLTQLAGIGDQTGDGIDDVVAVDYATGKLWLYPGPDYSQTKRRLLGEGWNGVSQVTGADVTGDGIGDVIAVVNWNGSLRMFPGKAGGGFGDAVTIGASGWNGMTGLTVTPPLAADGRKDIVAIEKSSGFLYAFPINSGGQSINNPVSLGSGWNAMADIVGGDFNNDGKGDIAAVQSASGNLLRYLGTGNATLGNSSLASPSTIGTPGSWSGMRDLAALKGIPGDASSDIIAVAKATGVQYLYHSAGATPWSDAARTTTGMSLYTSPSGEFETLASTAAGGWQLADKTGTVYTFSQPSGTGYLLSKITDRQQHSQSLAYTSGKLTAVTDDASGRALHLTWTADNRHIASVATDPVTGTDQATALTWTYTYDSANPDRLNQVCTPPTGTNTTRPCTTYGYTAGSHFRSAVLDAAPASYWRLGEASGTTASSEIIDNQAADNGTYTAVTLGTAGGPLTGSATTTAGFGSTSSLKLPDGSLRNSYLAVGLWFKTTTPGVLVGYQNQKLDTAPSHASQPLYIGTDGKLRGEFYGPAIGFNPITTSTAVTDGKWHYAVLSGAGDTQTLYLDGQQVGTLGGAIDHLDCDFTYIGAGYTQGIPWPAAPAAGAGGVNRFSGQIAEVALYQHALGAPAVTAQWAASQNASSELTNLALPSGKTKLAVTYDTLKDRATQVTDANGGVWKLNAPTVSGSEQEYRSAVLGSRPAGYWRLAESSASQAVNMINVARPTPNNGTYSNVTLGATGPMTGSAAATFDGKTSWAEIPAAYAPTGGSGTLSLWFKTTTAGVLIGYQSMPIGAAPVSGQQWNPALYVGTDGKLHGQFWTGNGANTLASAATVTDGKWHFAALSSENPTSQTLYLDGTAAGTLNAAIIPNGDAHVYVGAGTVSSGWPAAPTTDPSGHFTGQIAGVAAFDHGLYYGDKVGDLWRQAANGAAAYDAAVVDARPSGYWRLNDTTGNQATEYLTSQALAQNQGTYTNVTLGAAGPYSSGGTTAASFNGTTSNLQLPATAVPRTGEGATIEVWFKTASAGVIYGYQSFPLGSGTSGNYNPGLYVGTDHKLHGQMWTGSSVNTPVSDKTVDDNVWHHAALVVDTGGSSQQLYVDGVASGAPLVGDTKYNGDQYVYLGAGTAKNWPSAPADTDGHFNGQIADFAFYNSTLSATVISRHYTQATAPPGEGVSQSANYRSAITLQNPKGYWRLDEPAGATKAQDTLGTALPNQDHGTYNNVTLGTAGPTDTWDATAATFNGTTSTLQLPATAAPIKGPNSIELWFKTTTPGVLYAYQSFALGSAHTAAVDRWNPALYIGTDGKLYGALWTGDGANAITSNKTVTDNTWHHAVLAGDDSGQTLYLDGAQAAVSTTARTVYYNGSAYAYIGAGTAEGGWPNHPTNTDGRFTGSIAEVAFYPSRLNDDTVSTHYRAMGSAAARTKVTFASITDPLGRTATWRWDTRTGKLITTYDTTGGYTRYTYDTHGYLYTVTDPNGHTVTTGHDERGNTVSTTTCTTAADCHTSYATYALDTANPFNPANDHQLTASDARSKNADDTTYTTTYTYDETGNPTSTTLPATPGFTNGRTTNRTYTTGTEPAVGSSGNQPSALPATTTTPGGQTIAYAYDKAGNLTRTSNAAGLVTTYAYDNLGRLTARTENCTNCGTGQNAVTTNYTWDGLGNALTQTDPAATDAVTGTIHTRKTTTTYDNDGNRTTQTVSDTTGGDPTRTTTWTYNTTNNLLASTKDPANRTTSYTYDDYGNVTQKTDPTGTKWNYSYDGLSRKLRTGISNYTGSPTSPVPSRYQLLESLAYDPAGRLATVTDAMGRTIHHYYYDDDTLAETDLDGYRNTDGTQRNIVLEQNTYDAAGQLIQQVTGGGKTTVTTSYDAAGRTTSATLDPGGLNRTTTYTYNADDRVLTAAIAAGSESRQIDSTYDTAGNLTRSTIKNTPQNQVTTFTYDQRGRKTSETAPNGNVAGGTPGAFTTTYVHDPLDRLTQKIEPTVTTDVYNTSTGSNIQQQTAPLTTYGYDTFGDLTSVDDPNGNITTYTYNNNSEQTAAAENVYTAPGTATPIRPSTTVDYDTLGRPITTTVDPTGLARTTQATYDQLGNLVKLTEPPVNGTSPIWNRSYDLNGELLSSTDPTGAVNQATYDDLGRLMTATAIVRQPTPVANTTTFSYDDAGNLTGATDPRGHASTAAFNAAAELTSSTDSLGNTTRYTTNLTGEQTRVLRPDGTATVTTYDQVDNVIQTTDLAPDGTTELARTSATFDPDGNRLNAVDANGHTTTFEYDTADELIRQTQPTSATASITTTFGHDPAGNRTRFTRTRTTGAAATDVYYTYNTLGLPEATIEPPTAGQTAAADRTFTTAYNAAHEVVSHNSPGGIATSYTYDPGGNLTSLAGTGAAAVTATRNFTYDKAGRVLSAVAGTTTNSFTYDDRGLVLSQSGTGGSATFGYDANGNMTSKSDRAGAASFAYDNEDRLTTIDEPLTNTRITYQYDNTGQLLSAAYGTNASNRAFTYDGLHHLKTDTLKNPAGTAEAAITYAYDPAGRLTSKITTGLSGSGTNTYSYDWADRLTSWQNGTTTTPYTYDNNGNLLQSGTTTYTYDDRDRRITSGTTTYTYDARGALTTTTTPTGTTTSTYDAFEQLASTAGSTYTYDALGRLAETAGRSFNYDRISNDVTYDGTQTFDRDPAGRLLALTTNNGPVLALSDSHQDLIATFTATGTTPTSSTSYDPWGKVLSSTGPTTNIGYQDNWTDPATKLVNAHARWYDPTAGAFTSRDTLTLEPTTAAHANRYAYGDANPLTNTDRSGHTSFGGDGGHGEITSLDYLGGNPPQSGSGLKRLFGAPKEKKFSKKASAHDARRENHGDGPEQRENERRERQHRDSEVETARSQARHNEEAMGRWERSLNEPELPKSGATPARAHGGETGWRGSKGIDSPAKQAPNSPRPTSNNTNNPKANNTITRQSGKSVPGDGPDRPRQIESVEAPAGSSTPQRESHQQAGGNNGSGSDACSFSPETAVLMGDGTTKAIANVAPGDQIEAADPGTGRSAGPRTVNATWINHDNDLIDLTVQTADGSQRTIHTNQKHPFWDETTRSWIPAGNLVPGHDLISVDGAHVRVVVVEQIPGAANLYNLTVEELHTYYVLAGLVPVLVHNCGGTDPTHSTTCVCASGAQPRLASGGFGTMPSSGSPRHNRESEYPSQYRTPTHEYMVTRFTDEGRAAGGWPTRPDGSRKPRSELTWRDSSGEVIEFNDLTYDHSPMVVEHWNMEGYNSSRAERNDFYNEVSGMTAMGRPENSSHGSRMAHSGIRYRQDTGPEYSR
ncbi:LamG-like jellyroll fold domain-containing protein [Kitasatospora sp. NPDC048365]|uniref:LamG-like jellyroll fold domain-containing protein n=1 Tax=Kitasatospora sp. NPDC048365 TaxID=3364050 RepID=UPI00371DC2B1